MGIESQYITLRQRLATVCDVDAPPTWTSRIFNAVIAGMIIVNVAAVILETVKSINAHYAGTFAAIERAATKLFVMEYLLRVWTAVDLRGNDFRDPVWGRLRYMCSIFAIVDLFAILPAVLGLLGVNNLRVLRLLRLLRMVKLTRSSQVFSLIWTVLREEAEALGALVFLLCLTLTISGALMYMIEGQAQPTVFSSIPASMWWAIETLTTVGYGDAVPKTALGKILGGGIAIIGICSIALFSGLITVGFLNQLRLRREHDANDRGAAAHALGVCPHCGRPVANS
jgi:voltage-gated potassium channel